MCARARSTNIRERNDFSHMVKIIHGSHGVKLQVYIHYFCAYSSSYASNDLFLNIQHNVLTHVYVYAFVYVRGTVHYMLFRGTCVLSAEYQKIRSIIIS